MARVIEVRSKILSDDIFIINRQRLDTEIDQTGLNNKKTYTLTALGSDLSDFILSFQGKFLDVLKGDVRELTDQFNTISSDFVDLKLLHEEHYTTQTNELQRLDDQRKQNRDDYTVSSRVLRFIETQTHRLTRLYHVVPDRFNERQMVEGNVKFVVPAGEDNHLENVNELYVHRTDATLNERNFWGVFPGDILEIVGQEVSQGGDGSDTQIETTVTYRASYRVRQWDPYGVKEDFYRIPVEWIGGGRGEFDYYTKYQEDIIPSDAKGNTTDFPFAQLSIFPALNSSYFATTKTAYLEYVRTFPIGSVVMWLSDTLPNEQEYGQWEKKNWGNEYLVALGRSQTAMHEYKSLNSSNKTQNTAAPSGGASVNAAGSHRHGGTISTSSAGGHYHWCTSKDLVAGTGSDVWSGRAKTQYELLNGKKSFGAKSNNFPPSSGNGTMTFYNSAWSDHKHGLTINSYTGKHSHTWSSSSWDTYNRMNSWTVHYIQKKTHPQFINEMKALLEVYYGPNFDK